MAKIYFQWRFLLDFQGVHGAYQGKKVVLYIIKGSFRLGGRICEILLVVQKSGSPVEVSSFSHYLRGLINIPGGAGCLPWTVWPQTFHNMHVSNFLRYHSRNDSSNMCHLQYQEKNKFQISALSRWWFQISSSFTQIIWIMIQFDEHLFF